ncbi:hypothetical protein CO166_04450 [Candidatus Roizmanbacteria bacterium CG_4_9_14_3_um_filter_36_11]|nr:MAG: hypothetical protein CO166_04450 [Candidatus Roizmanbacteria bacterium CG_4_9_14_3_um_filter_36_11]
MVSIVILAVVKHNPDVKFVGEYLPDFVDMERFSVFAPQFKFVKIFGDFRKSMATFCKHFKGPFDRF